MVLGKNIADLEKSIGVFKENFAHRKKYTERELKKGKGRVSQEIYNGVLGKKY